MNVAHVLGYLAPQYGGPPNVALHLGREMTRFGVTGTWWATATAEEMKSLKGLGDRALLFPYAFPRGWHRSPALSAMLGRRGPEIDLFHLHQVWDHPVYSGARIARSLRKPYLVTPHGIFLHRWRYRGLKKKLYLRLLARPFLNRAACLHAVSREEMEGFAEASLTAPPALVPSGVDVAEFDSLPSRQVAHDTWPDIGRGPVVLFFGRLSPEKGLHELIAGWRIVLKCYPQAQLVLAGPDSGGHLKQLEAAAAHFGVRGSILMPGFIRGPRKTAVWSLATVYVQASSSEAFSISVLEALASAKPCVITENCSFPEVARAGAGEVVEARADALAQGLIKVLSLTDRERQDMGERGRQLVAENYTWDLAARKMLTVYRCILDKKPVPLYPEPAPLP
ncbi:MAG TPA: glycosyltransferase [Candidatus Aminicenantes bacterium]|nr:glycosyltransferase [Candidatus Aminicenantes bacterium]